MKNTINLHSVLLVFILSIFCITTLLAQEEQIRKDISLIAERDFKNFLDIIPVGLEKYYGFSNREEFCKAFLGKPICTFNINKPSINTEYIDTSKTNYQITELWNIPIIVEGNICCLLKVRSNGNQYSVVGIGGSQTALEIDNAVKKMKLNEEKEFSILISPETKTRYLIFYDHSITYKNSKGIKIGGNNKSDNLNELTLLDILKSLRYN